MKNIIFSIIISLAVIQSVFAQDFSEQIELTKNVIQLFEKDQTEEIYSMFDDTMKSAITAEKLGEIWSSLPLQCGKYNGYGEAIGTESQGMTVVNNLLDFENVDLDIKLAFNQQNQISGLFFVPATKKRIADTELVSNLIFEEAKIKLVTGEFQLPGIITIPTQKDTYPIVIFIHGSGPHDRDETIGPNKPFRDLARGLAKYGIASLRFDKRTFIYGKKSTSDGRDIDINTEVLEDAATAVQYCSNLNDAESIYVLGHSLGGMLAPKIASENEKVNGIIMMAANSRPLEDLIIDQYLYLLSPNGITDQEQQTINELNNQITNLRKNKLGASDTTLALPLGLSYSYWQSLNEYDQIDAIQSLTQRILVLQGERDYQVTSKDFELWEQALINNQNATFKSYTLLNHLFLEGEGPSLPSEYQQKSNIPEYVINDIAIWILQK